MHPRKPKLDDAITQQNGDNNVLTKHLDRTGYSFRDLSALSCIPVKRLKDINEGVEMTDSEADRIVHILCITLDDII